MSELAIKNWTKYQTTTKRNAPWIKDDTHKDLDDKYSDLTMVERYVLDACCRLRGRIGRNITDDPLAICRAIAIKPQDRHNCTKALKKLIDRGFLVVINQQLDVAKVPPETEGEAERETEEEGDARALPPLALAQKVASELVLPGEPGVIRAVANAIEYLVKQDGKSPNSAVEFLIASGKDAADRGRPPTRFWFSDRGWVSKFVPVGSAKKSTLERNLDVLNEIK